MMHRLQQHFTGEAKTRSSNEDRCASHWHVYQRQCVVPSQKQSLGVKCMLAPDIAKPPHKCACNVLLLLLLEGLQGGTPCDAHHTAVGTRLEPGPCLAAVAAPTSRRDLYFRSTVLLAMEGSGGARSHPWANSFRAARTAAVMAKGCCCCWDCCCCCCCSGLALLRAANCGWTAGGWQGDTRHMGHVTSLWLSCSGCCGAMAEHW